MAMDFLFKIETPLGFTVTCTQKYWDFIVQSKHPALRGHLEDVKATLSAPTEIRRSKKDPHVFLFYAAHQTRWICAVTKKSDDTGFLITAYPTDSIKAGESVWKRSK
jgi:hypothetical protein